jgi:16S rRNA (cytosine1402-N4)-methyltransferase
MEKSIHVSVLCKEVVEALLAEKGGHFLDCTLGGAGHSRAILDANPQNTLVAIDRDARAVIRANRSLEKYEGRVQIMHSSFSEIKDVLLGQKFDGVLADLGTSMDQLKENRGFSFNDEVTLDMRMDEGQELSALHIVNKLAERDLLRILKIGGVGREANAAARAIIKARPIETTKELATVVSSAIRGMRADKKGNPATVVFQAIRIAVNNEYEEIEALMQAVPHLIRPSGRFAVIAFHSLEDKLVTNRMRAWESQDTYPALWRGPRGEVPALGKLLTKKAVLASEDEMQANPSSRSARLRVFSFAQSGTEKKDGVLGNIFSVYKKTQNRKVTRRNHK